MTARGLVGHLLVVGRGLLVALVATWGAMVGPPAWAQNAPPGFTVMGLGGEPCAAWTQARGSGGAYPFESWIAGYLTAFNALFASRQNLDVFAQIDPAKLLGWLDNYCRSHPREAFWKATDELVIELMKPGAAQQ